MTTNTKKLLKVLGIATLTAAITPYRFEKDCEKDETSIHALLWRFTNRPHPDFEGKRQRTIDFGFHFNRAKLDWVCDCCEEDDFDLYDAEFTCCEDDCCCGCASEQESSTKTSTEDAPNVEVSEEEQTHEEVSE